MCTADTKWTRLNVTHNHKQITIPMQSRKISLDQTRKQEPQTNYIEKAWNSNPQICLRLLFNLGNVRKDGNGKMDRKNFYRSLLWLARENPKTFLRNLAMIPRHSSLKCLLNIVMLVIHEWTTDWQCVHTVFVYVGLRGDVYGAYTALKTRDCAPTITSVRPLLTRDMHNLMLRTWDFVPTITSVWPLLTRDMHNLMCPKCVAGFLLIYVYICF